MLTSDNIYLFINISLNILTDDTMYNKLTIGKLSSNHFSTFEVANESCY